MVRLGAWSLAFVSSSRSARWSRSSSSVVPPPSARPRALLASWCDKHEWQIRSRLVLIRCCFRCSPPGLFCKLRQEGAHSAPRTYRRDRMSSPPSPSPSPPSPSPLPSPPPPSQSPGGGNMMPGVATAGGSASYDPEAAYEDKDSYSPELDSLPPLAKHIQRHHTPLSPPPPKHMGTPPPHTPPPSPPRIAISLAPDGDYLNALSAAVLAAVAVVLLGYVCYQRRRSQSFALRARTRLSDEDSASTSAAVQLELPTASRRPEEVSDM